LLIGHSHLMLATDKKRLEQETGLKVSKYCREGVNVSDKKMMIEHFLNSGYADSLKYVFYGVDLATFTGEGLSKNSYKLFYPFMSNEYVDEYIKSQSSNSDYWLHKLVKTTRFNDDGLKNSAIRGWLNNWDNFKSNIIDIEGYKQKLVNDDERHIKMNPEIMEAFSQTVKMITDRGIMVVLVNTPTLDLLNNYEPDKYSLMMEWFTTFANENDLVEFVDYNPKYSSDYSIFSDRLHLNRKGQEIITTELIKRLRNEGKYKRE
ncbi:MAG: SGNH/GDSL hydrolase family protein, partial [Muribaculum sp.]|nr:SGNH/GDSL hydrolase family protein [Muribaculum sp.]